MHACVQAGPDAAVVARLHTSGQGGGRRRRSAADEWEDAGIGVYMYVRCESREWHMWCSHRRITESAVQCMCLCCVHGTARCVDIVAVLASACAAADEEH